MPHSPRSVSATFPVEDAARRPPHRLPLCLAGCGGMGRRHLSGYAALAGAGLWRGELVAVFDVRQEAAEAVADDAERLLGHRPRVHTSLDAVLADPDIAALDLVTDPSSHHAVAVPALSSGRHVLCEKPLGLTVRACRAMLAAAESGNAVLATAENYRRGGANRTARAVVEAGLLGRPHLMVQHLVGGDDRVIITPWRHLKERGTIALDMVVHHADLVEFYLGPVETVYGRALIAEPVRHTADGDHRSARPARTPCWRSCGPRSGVEVQLAYLPSGPGHRYVRRTIHGIRRLDADPAGPQRGEVELRRADGVLRGAQVRAALGDGFVLDDTTTALLGPDGTGGGAPFLEVDAGYLGIEIGDFVAAVLTGRPPEVDGLGGMRRWPGARRPRVGRLGRPVTVDEVLSGARPRLSGRTSTPHSGWTRFRPGRPPRARSRRRRRGPMVRRSARSRSWSGISTPRCGTGPRCSASVPGPRTRLPRPGCGTAVTPAERGRLLAPARARLVGRRAVRARAAVVGPEHLRRPPGAARRGIATSRQLRRGPIRAAVRPTTWPAASRPCRAPADSAPKATAPSPTSHRPAAAARSSS